MDTKPLEKFAQAARRQLHEQVKIKLERVLRTDSAELRAKADTVAELQKQVATTSREVVIERVAYTWFNRFCALRYMDANQYTRSGVVSPAQGFTQPEILQMAKQGHIDPDLAANLNQQIVFDLLTGRRPSSDGQQEAYRLLLVAACNYYHTIMPFLFERIDDYTELLMPDDLLSPGSILTATREALTPEVCQDVEVIGWLYQFYISEKKDKVIGAKQPISAENIPAATQLFTPHWIVRYLVENSLGRLWLLNRPHSRLAEQMPFYIKPEQEETGFLRLTSPEELRICDPAVGSAHMLTYAFDLLYAIYEEEGYSGPEIPRLILEKNLVGLEIDERAGALAAFALVMKARARDRRFFARNVRPHICVLQPITFQEGELRQESWLQKLSLDQQETLLHDLHLFREADNVGSLLQPQTLVELLTRLRTQLQGEILTDLYAHERRKRVLQALEQAEYLAQKYHVVIANPPYMGNVNDRLKKFLNDEYKDVKSDTFSAFIIRCLKLALPNGQLGFMTPFTWMFLSSYEKLRKQILEATTLTSLIRPEYHAFFDSAYVPICSFTLYAKSLPDYKGAFIDLQNFYGADVQPIKALEAIQNPDCGWFYRAAAADFKKIPGSPIIYQFTDKILELFKGHLFQESPIYTGMATSDNARFLRFWHEVENAKIDFHATSVEDTKKASAKWFPYNKGGSAKKWYGNFDYIVNFANDGEEIKAEVNRKYPYLNGNTGFYIRYQEHYFKEGLTWSAVSSGMFTVRKHSKHSIFSNAGFVAIPNGNLHYYIALLNSSVALSIIGSLAQTLNFNASDIAKLPVIFAESDATHNRIDELTQECIDISREEWDSREISWDFKTNELVRFGNNAKYLLSSGTEAPMPTLGEVFNQYCNYWREKFLGLHSNEEALNRIFIELYELHEELTPKVDLENITILKLESIIEKGRLIFNADELARQLTSYAVGCMFGRYSLDKPGLILANQGDTLDDYLHQVPHPTFLPDKDNAIPILDGDWFPDDISERFKRFLRLTFGDSHYEENLAFIEEAIGRDIRSYFLRDFYSHHIKMYKKRPIYWLFSSPNGSFNVLIYMHRYRPDTVSVILNDYLREFRAKLQGHKAHLQQVSISPSSSPRDKTRAIKDTEQLDRILNELSDYENNILYPLATRQVQIDLDDGVLVNYNKLGPALKKIAGMSKE